MKNILAERVLGLPREAAAPMIGQQLMTIANDVELEQLRDALRGFLAAASGRTRVRAVTKSTVSTGPVATPGL